MELSTTIDHYQPQSTASNDLVMMAPFANQAASHSEFELAPIIAAGVDQGRRGSFLMSGDNYHKKLLTLQRLRRAQTAIAYAMSLDGPVYGPIF